MRKFIIGIILVIDIILLGLSNHEFTTHKENYLSNNIIAYAVEDSTLNYHNIYYKDMSFNYAQTLTNNTITNKQDIINLIYTVINNGYDTYSFKCSEEYENCESDLVDTLNNGYILSILNNLVHPYNSINSLSLSYNPTLKELELKSYKKYTNEQIQIIDYKIDSIIKQIITSDMTDKQKIKKVHDYLANNISYVKGNYSDSAYGALVYRQAICSGYSDTLSLFLTKLDIPNYKVVTTSHVWNIVYLNNEFLHIDLTWDDPNNIYATNVSTHEYFLINTNNLMNKDNNHKLDLSIYSELS